MAKKDTDMIPRKGNMINLRMDMKYGEQEHMGININIMERQILFFSWDNKYKYETLKLVNNNSKSILS